MCFQNFNSYFHQKLKVWNLLPSRYFLRPALRNWLSGRDCGPTQVCMIYHCKFCGDSPHDGSLNPYRRACSRRQDSRSQWQIMSSYDEISCCGVPLSAPHFPPMILPAPTYQSEALSYPSSLVHLLISPLPRESSHLAVGDKNDVRLKFSREDEAKISVSSIASRGELIHKSILVEAYLFHAESPWSPEDIVAYPSRTRLPGESSFRLDTLESATLPRRQPVSQRRRNKISYIRNNGGACNDCRATKKAVSTNTKYFWYTNTLTSVC